MTEQKQAEREAVMAVVAKLTEAGKADVAATLRLAYEYFENDDIRAKVQTFVAKRVESR